MFATYENTSFDSSKEAIRVIDDLIKLLCKFGQGHKDLTARGRETVNYLKEQWAAHVFL